MTNGRHFPDWLTAYLDYASHSEAPRHMHFWSAVGAVAGALRRRVWVPRGYVKWYPNFYICLVAPPGVVAKSTTVGIAMRLLRQVPGVHFGPDIATWPALVTAFSRITEGIDIGGDIHVMSAMTLESSELGNLIDTRDKQMMNLLISLWDGADVPIRKETKTNGNDEIQNPWINLVACTTPSWIADNIPEYMLGGGLISRMIFVYADKKAKLIAHPELEVPQDLAKTESLLVEDLTHIATTVAGPMQLTPEAYAFGQRWYEEHEGSRGSWAGGQRLEVAMARKQVQMYKLAMVLSVATGDDRIITEEHLRTAYTMLTDLEPDMQFVFSKMGRSDSSLQVERLVTFIHFRGRVSFPEAYRYVHSYFPSIREFEDALAGCVKAGYIKLERQGTDAWLSPGEPLPQAANGGRPDAAPPSRNYQSFTTPK